MADRFRIYLMGFRAPAKMEELDRYLEQILNVRDEKLRKKLLFDTPSLLAELDSREFADSIKSDIGSMGARVEIKPVKIAPAPEITVLPQQPATEVPGQAPQDTGEGNGAQTQPGAVEAGTQIKSPAGGFTRQSVIAPLPIILPPMIESRPSRPWVRYIVIVLVAALCGAFAAETAILLKSKPKKVVEEVPVSETTVEFRETNIKKPDKAKDTGDIRINVQPAVPAGDLPPGLHPELNEAVTFLNKGQYEDAYHRVDIWITAHPGDRSYNKGLIWLLMSIAEGAFRKNDLQTTVRALSRAIDLNPDDPELLAQLGAVYYVQKDYGRSLSYLEDALRLGSRDPNVHVIMALILYLYRDNLVEAENHLNTAIAAMPGRDDLIGLRDKIRRERNVESKLEQATGSHFTVKYDGMEDRDAGYTVLYILDKAYSDVGYAMGEYPNESVIAILYTRQQFQEVTQAPHWAGGVYSAMDGRIRLPAGGLPNRDDNDLRRVLYHEYTHSVIHSMAGENCPIWINEGLAMIMQERAGLSRDPWVKTENLKNRSIPSLQAMNASFVQLTGAEVILAYTESYYATQFLLQQYGQTTVNQLLKELGKGSPFPQAFRKITGTEFPVFEERFFNNLKTTME